MPTRKHLVLLLLCLAGSISASAFTPKTRARILDDALKLCPPTLRVLLQSKRDFVIQGMEQAAARERDLWVSPQDGSGTLPVRVAGEVKRIKMLFESNGSMDQAAAGFGRLLYYATELNLPWTAFGEKSGVAYQDDFRLYIEHHSKKFRVVFDGYQNPSVNLTPDQYVLKRVQSMTNSARILDQAYYPGGRGSKHVKSLKTFDVRSTPYAICQLSFTHASSDTVKLWVHLWQELGGDMSGTPFWKKPAASQTEASK